MRRTFFRALIPFSLLSIVLFFVFLSGDVKNPHLAFAAAQATVAPNTALKCSIPTDANLAANYPDQFMWQMFIAINWPLSGAQDCSGTLGSAPVVWESWRLQQEVYLPDGSDPTQWKPSSAGKHILTNNDCLPVQQKVLRLFRTQTTDSNSVNCDPNAAPGHD